MHDTFFLWPVALCLCLLQRPGTLQRAAAPDKLDISKPNHHHLIKECQLNLLGHVARQVVASVAAVVAVVAVALAVAGDAVAVLSP